MYTLVWVLFCDTGCKWIKPHDELLKVPTEVEVCGLILIWLARSFRSKYYGIYCDDSLKMLYKIGNDNKKGKIRFVLKSPGFNIPLKKKCSNWFPKIYIAKP